MVPEPAVLAYSIQVQYGFYHGTLARTSIVLSEEDGLERPDARRAGSS